MATSTKTSYDGDDEATTTTRHQPQHLFFNPPAPALTWGDAPWAPGNEVWNGVLRGIQVYSGLLTTSEMLSEANAPLSTASGANTIWYLNMNPTPTDISDKSGKGHNPSWVGSERPALYSDTSSSDITPPAPPTGLQLQEQGGIN